MGYRPISEYGIIGNDDRCVLVSAAGSIDWCCFPDVAGPSVFAHLLDDERGGHFAVQPTDTYDARQEYVDRTNVLRTRFETATGRATLTDFMPVGTGDWYPEVQHALYRRIQCDDGLLTVEVDCRPRFDYARANTTVEYGEYGTDGTESLVATGDDERALLQVHGPLPVEARGDRVTGTVTLEAGEEAWLVFQYDHFEPVSPEECRELEDETVDYWQDWAGVIEERAASIVGDDPWLDEVVRSGLVLKLLINEGNGAIYAAVTTSLPETYGGTRNWDYRYNWIRDAKFTVQALYNLGQEEAAHDYFEWFRDIGHEDPGNIQPVYGVHGERNLPERELDHLAGYRHSSPVRVGNGAADQFQLDVYGAIVQGLYETLLHEDRITREDWNSIQSIVNHVCDVWDRKDQSIWEYRGEPRHYVYSKLLCWVALDRGIKLAENHDQDDAIDRWRRERAAIRRAIEERGYSESAGSFVQHFETEETLDASSLLIPVYEFLPPDDYRVEETLDTVLDRLLTEEGLVRRTDGPDAPEEGPGAFLMCSFWLVDALVVADRVEEAREVFTNALDHLRPPYLLSERIDPRTGEFLGNFPQAFSHIGLINSATYLGSASGDRDLEHDPREEGSVRPLFRT